MEILLIVFVVFIIWIIVAIQIDKAKTANNKISDYEKTKQTTVVYEDKSEYKRKTLPPIEDPNKNIGYRGIVKSNTATFKLDSDFDLNLIVETTTNDHNYEEDNFIEYKLEEIPVVIHYKKGNGEISNRMVDVISYEKTDFAYSSYIYGYCHLRNEHRTFRADRIQSLADGETGEIIKDMKSYFIKKYESSIYYKMDCLFEKYKEIFRVLFYIAKADGSYLKAEKEIIREAIRKLINDNALSDELIDEMINKLDIPSFNAFKIDVKSISKQNLQIDIFKIALDIVNTQNTIHSREREALEYMAENLDNVSKDDIIYKADVLEQQKKQKALERIEKNRLKLLEKEKKQKIDEVKKECPECHTKNTLKKGTRRLKNHSIQRYQCNDCGKIFSEKIEEDNN